MNVWNHLEMLELNSQWESHHTHTSMAEDLAEVREMGVNFAQVRTGGWGREVAGEEEAEGQAQARPWSKGRTR